MFHTRNRGGTRETTSLNTNWHVWNWNEAETFSCNTLTLFQTGGDVLRFTTFAVASHHTKSEVDRPTISKKFVWQQQVGVEHPSSAQESPSPHIGSGRAGIWNSQPVLHEEYGSQSIPKVKLDVPRSEQVLTCNIWMHWSEECFWKSSKKCCVPEVHESTSEVTTAQKKLLKTIAQIVTK